MDMDADADADTRQLQFGDRLANGARVILVSARQRDGSVIVLAEFRGDELVVWTLDSQTGDTFNGRYFAKDALNDAVRHLNERADTGPNKEGLGWSSSSN